MKKSSGDTREDIDNVTAKIVRIAYRQSREISGSNDPEDTEKSSKQNSTEFVCTQRLANLPIVASINSSITGAYTSVKQSHPTVEKIFGTTEEGFSEGAQMVAPVISKIESTLKEPLKCLDAVICDGLDYLENNVPSVKLPPAEMYDNIEEYVRSVSDTVKAHSNAFYADLKLKLEELMKTMEEAGEESKKPEQSSESTKPGNDH